MALPDMVSGWPDGASRAAGEVLIVTARGGGWGGEEEDDKLPQLLTIPCQSQVDSKKLVRYPRHRLLKAFVINLKFQSSSPPTSGS